MFKIQKFCLLITLHFCVLYGYQKKTAIISLYSINWLVCITETECVYCAVWTGSLYIILRSAHTVYLCVLCGSENKQRLFPYTTLTDRFLQPRGAVFTNAYNPNTYNWRQILPSNGCHHESQTSLVFLSSVKPWDDSELSRLLCRPPGLNLSKLNPFL